MLSKDINTKACKNNHNQWKILWTSFIFLVKENVTTGHEVTHSLLEVCILSIFHFSQRYMFCTLHIHHTKFSVAGKSECRRGNGTLHKTLSGLLLRSPAEPKEWKLKGGVVYGPSQLGRWLLPLLGLCEASAIAPSPLFKREIGKLERVQRRAMERARVLEHTRCEVERRQLGYSPCKSNVGKEGPDCSLSLNWRRTVKLLSNTQLKDKRQPSPAAVKEIKIECKEEIPRNRSG